MQAGHAAKASQGTHASAIQPSGERFPPHSRIMLRMAGR
jgi:hypothetical protein